MELRQLLIESTGHPGIAATRIQKQSDGIDDDTAEAVRLWCPGRTDLLKSHKQAFSFFCPGDHVFAVSKSVIAPETPLCPQKQVLTKVILIDEKQFQGYYHNASLLLHFLRSSGSFNFRFEAQGEFGTLKLPEKATANLAPRQEAVAQMEDIEQSLKLHGQIALVGIDDPLGFIGGVLNELHVEIRSQLSFVCGLQPALGRPFVTHLFREDNAELSKTLADNHIRRIGKPPVAATKFDTV